MEFPRKLFVIMNQEFGEDSPVPQAFKTVDDAVRYQTGEVSVAEYVLNQSFRARCVAEVIPDSV